MCGIAGLLSLSLQPLPKDSGLAVKSMLEAMKHRGPDGEGLWQDKSVCFGHRRLSIIDLAGGSQPMLDFEGKYCIVFNGEIYNFKELRARLRGEGFKFATDSDTEVILNAYACWGKACLQKLEGMFAFALWDISARTLFCARDHFGKKPFYYSIQNGIFAFSSDLNSLCRLTHWQSFPFSFTLKRLSILRYLAYEYVPTPDSIYVQAKVLEPAHFLLIKDSQTLNDPYWSLPMPQLKRRNLPELEEELYARMHNAVKARMVSDVPLGVFLSGGIDSTIVAGLMADVSPLPIRAFSIGFTEKSYDESRYAAIAAQAFGARHYDRILSADECADELPGIVAKMDIPMADASSAPTWLLSGLAREHVTVALGGDGADELWAGYEHYIGYKLSLIYNRLPGWLRKRLIEPLTSLLPESAGYINPKLAMKAFLSGCHAPDWLRVQAMLTAMQPEMIKNVINRVWLGDDKQDLLEDSILFEPTKIQFDYWRQKPEASPLARAFHVYCRQFLLDDILVKVDRLSMLHSLEVRAPFLDKHVAEFAASLPITCKLHGFKRKYLLKKTFAKLLPPAILKRNKRGFQIPVAEWLRGKLQPLLRDMASETYLRSQGIFSYQGINRLIEEHLSGKEDFRKPLWTFLIFQLWWEARNRPGF